MFLLISLSILLFFYSLSLFCSLRFNFLSWLSFLSYQSNYLFLYLSIYLFLYLSVTLFHYLSISLSIYLYIHKSISLRISISISLSISISIYFYINLSIYLSITVTASLPQEEIDRIQREEKGSVLVPCEVRYSTFSLLSIGHLFYCYSCSVSILPLFSLSPFYTFYFQIYFYSIYSISNCISISISISSIYSMYSSDGEGKAPIVTEMEWAWVPKKR